MVRSGKGFDGRHLGMIDDQDETEMLELEEDCYPDLFSAAIMASLGSKLSPKKTN